MERPQILVVGAINVDLVERVHHLPLPGETVQAVSSYRSPGGKAANQAAAAAAGLSGHGGRTFMVGSVGDDQDGADQIDALELAHVDTRLIRRVVGTPTGSAVVVVDAQGENSIVINAGANGFVSPSNLYGAPTASVVIAQTEVSAAAVTAAARHARAHGARLIVNNAPVIHLGAEVLLACDPLVVNEGEARLMIEDIAPGSAHSREHLASQLARLCGCRSVVVTLGKDGCAWITDGQSGTVPGRTIAEVVDTTGAGDTFVGALAAALALGDPLPVAAETATDAAAQSVRWSGTRSPVAIGATGRPVPE